MRDVPDPAALDEQQLVERARQDPDAFAELYRRYVDRIHRFATRRTGSSAAADDVTSATFERALAKLDRYRWQPSGIGPWLFRLASNEIAEHHRGRARHGTDRAQAALGRWYEPSTVDRVADPVADRQLLDAIDRLRPRHQQAIGLTYFADLDRDEAAAAMGMTPATFAVAVHRARAALRRALEEETP